MSGLDHLEWETEVAMAVKHHFSLVVVVGFFFFFFGGGGGWGCGGIGLQKLVALF